MIIVACTDDPGLIQVATNSRQANPAFGDVYRVFAQQIPRLGVNEQLFILAHGAMEGDDNNPVIGDEQDAFFVNAVDLYENVASIFPVGYGADIYVDACESANYDHYNERATFSFTEVLKAQVQRDHPHVRVFGRNGAVGGLIPPPGNGWQEALG